MSLIATDGGAEQASFELKATTYTLPTLRLLDSDLGELSRFLEPKIQQAPAFFRNAPVVIDLTRLPDVRLDFPLLVGLLRGLGMLPIGVRGGSETHKETARLMDLAILSQGGKRSAAIPGEPAADAPSAPKRATAAATAKEQPPKEAPAAQPAAAAPAPEPERAGKVVTRPVRSGQRVYAAGGDLIVLAPVSAGAELMADGHVHVYGALRGRALAGVKGNTDARIFCHDLRAELISVAGHYRVSENLEAAHVGRPVQIYLREGRLIIEAL
jgi:septum site-determining protein MinC